jgi:hypothetical protein
MKKIITPVFTLIALLAFAQTSSTHTQQTTTEPITVTGTALKLTTKEGAATSYQPVKTLIVREDGRIIRVVMSSMDLVTF